MLATTEDNGILVRVPPGRPRVLGFVSPPCSSSGCSGALRMGVYLDKPATVAMTFGPTATSHRVQTGKQINTLPPNRPTTLNFKLPKGDRSVTVPVDWTDPTTGPVLESVVLNTGGKTERIY